MRHVLVAALLAVGCKGKATPAQEQPVHGSAAAPAAAIDWPACEAAIARAASAPLAARPQLVIDGCRVCGDWTPILRWNTPTTAGGPKRFDIEAAMTSCKAYCNSDAKTKFLGTLDDARGTGSRMPWKQLAILCTDRVSAVPDGRFMNGAYFALDRIARAVASHGGAAAATLATLDLPLPALSVVGNGPPLPALANGVSPNVSELQITVLGTTMSVGTMPRARLTADGVKVDLGADGYPGKTVTAAELGPALTALAGGDKTKTVSILMPKEMSTEALGAVVAAAAPVMPVYLAARAHESPVDLDLPAALPVMLGTGGTDVVHVAKNITAQALAESLAQLAARGVTRIGIAAREL